MMANADHRPALARENDKIGEPAMTRVMDVEGFAYLKQVGDSSSCPSPLRSLVVLPG